MNNKIIVVTHKDYQMPDDSLYMPICVGTGLKTLSNKFQPNNLSNCFKNMEKMLFLRRLQGVTWNRLKITTFIR